jgi:hypothetical protein
MNKDFSQEQPMSQRIQKRVDLIGSLGRQRDTLLNSPVFDLAKARALLLAYEVAGLEAGTADLRRRVEWYEAQTA